MPTLPSTVTRGGDRMTARHCSWTGLATADDGAWVELPEFHDRSVQVLGTFGGGTVTIQGSNEATPSTGVTLSIPGSAAGSASLTAAGLIRLQENTRWVRPVVTGGTATGIAVHLLARV